jgi:hypothetical protein
VPPQNTRAAKFLRDERIPLNERFEVGVRILCPGPETARWAPEGPLGLNVSVHLQQIADEVVD